MNDIVKIAEQIEGKIGLLRDHRKTLIEKGKVKATTAAAYDKAIAIALIRLEHGDELILDGFPIKEPAKSIMEKVAKGYCEKELYAKELAETDYKSTVVAMESLRAEINGYQSMNRHLSEV